MNCTNCGHEINGDGICHNCGILADIRTSHIPNTGKKKIDTERYCAHCGNVVDKRQKTSQVAHIKESYIKKSGIAAVLSFFIPGLGQIYKGRIGTGSIFLIIGAFLLEIVRLIISDQNVRKLIPDIRYAMIPGIREYVPDIRIIIFIIVYILFWIYNIHHAYFTNEELEKIKKDIEKQILACGEKL